MFFSLFYTYVLQKKETYSAGIVMIVKRHISNSRTETKGFDF